MARPSGHLLHNKTEGSNMEARVETTTKYANDAYPRLPLPICTSVIHKKTCTIESHAKEPQQVQHVLTPITHTCITNTHAHWLMNKPTETILIGFASSVR